MIVLASRSMADSPTDPHQLCLWLSSRLASRLAVGHVMRLLLVRFALVLQIGRVGLLADERRNKDVFQAQTACLLTE
eukprot:1147710-Pelagomonas_calceolata.AAC.2